MLWWIVADDTISAHEVSVKILRRFRAERSCPHHIFFFKKGVLCAVLLLGSLAHLVFWGRCWIPPTQLGHPAEVSKEGRSLNLKPGRVVAPEDDGRLGVLVQPGVVQQVFSCEGSYRARWGWGKKTNWTEDPLQWVYNVYSTCYVIVTSATGCLKSTHHFRMEKWQKF